MYTLVFDTCFDKSYIVLKSDDSVLESKIIENTDSNYHSVYLIPTIKDILNKNNLFIKDIDAIGVNIGPGSFTGIRAGITIARVLCQQFNIKLVGVSSLKILSYINNSDATVVMDARKNKVYYAKYYNSEEIVAPILIDKEDLIAKINSNDVIIADSSISEFLSSNNISSINFQNRNDNLGLYLSNIVSELLLSSSESYNWAKVKPLYIQMPSITKPKEKNNV